MEKERCLETVGYIRHSKVEQQKKQGEMDYKF